MTADEEIEISRITITKQFDQDADGGSSCTVHYSDGLSLIDALGMLAFATAFTPQTYTDDEETHE